MNKIVYGVVASPLLLALACSSSSSPPGTGSAPPAGSSVSSTASAPTLRGTYTPAAGTSGAQFSSIAFDDATSTYAYTRAGCTGFSCTSTGTYTVSGASDLALTDSTTHATEHITFQAQKSAATAAAIRSFAGNGALHPLGGGSIVNLDAGSLVSTDAGLLVSMDGGSLFQTIEQVLQALLNGVLMELDKGSGASAMSGDDDDDDASTGTDASTAAAGVPSMSDVDARGAIAELQAQLTSGPLASYYQDGSRVEGCWFNPSGKNLTDIQHAFYCSMPLEFRLCNSIPLLATDDSQVASRWQSFQQCEQRVNTIAQNNGQFLYDAKVSATYYWLFLNKQSGLSAADEATLAASVKPVSSGRSFPTLVGVIASSVLGEAGSSAFNGLQPLLTEAQTAAAAAGADIP